MRHASIGSASRIINVCLTLIGFVIRYHPRIQVERRRRCRYELCTMTTRSGTARSGCRGSCTVRPRRGSGCSAPRPTEGGSVGRRWRLRSSWSRTRWCACSPGLRPTRRSAAHRDAKNRIGARDGRTFVPADAVRVTAYAHTVSRELSFRLPELQPGAYLLVIRAAPGGTTVQQGVWDGMLQVNPTE